MADIKISEYTTVVSLTDDDIIEIVQGSANFKCALSQLADFINVGIIGGSTGATDNALLRADGTGGSTVQASNIFIDDFGNIDIFGGATAPSLSQVRLEVGAGNNASDVHHSFRMYHTGTNLAGIGTGMQFAVRTATNHDEIIATIEAVCSDVTDTSEDGYVVIKTMAAGAAASERIRLNENGATITGKLYVSALNTAPSSASDTGTLGEIRFTSDYIFVCVATNTWKRTAISTW